MAGRKSIAEAITQITSEAGIRGLFVGWRIRFSMYLLHAMVTTDLLDKLEVTVRLNKQSID